MKVIGDVSRLCDCLIILRLFLSMVKFVGFGKCFSNALAISLLEVARLLLNFIDLLRSMLVGSLLLSDLIIVQ